MKSLLKKALNTSVADIIEASSNITKKAYNASASDAYKAVNKSAHKAIDKVLYAKRITKLKLIAQELRECEELGIYESALQPLKEEYAELLEQIAKMKEA